MLATSEEKAGAPKHKAAFTREPINYSNGLAFAAMGMNIFPVGSDKMPLVSWTTKATTDIDTIKSWWNDPRTAGFGYVTGNGYGDVDLDVKNPDANGIKSWAEWCATHGVQNVEPYSTSKSGGKHILYKTTEPLPNRVGMLLGVDYRGERGYTVIYGPPPEVIPEMPKAVTELIRPDYALKFKAVPAGLTFRQLEDDLQRRYKAYVENALKDQAALLAAAPTGTRNSFLNDSALKLFHYSWILDEQTISDTLYAAALACGLPDERIKPTLASGGNAGKSQPWLPRFSSDDRVDELEEAVFNSTPTLSHIKQASISRLSSPWAVLGITLAKVLCEISPSVVLPPIVGSYASLNFYVALVGASGSGKSTSIALVDEVLNISDQRHVEIGPGSGEGIVQKFMEVEPGDKSRTLRVAAFPYRFLVVDEIGAVGAIKQRNGNTLMPTLQTMWSGKSCSTSAAETARDRTLPANSYRLTAVAGIQPKKSDILLNEAERDAGTPQRWIWLPTEYDNYPEVLPDFPGNINWKRPTFRPVDSNGFSAIQVPAKVSQLITLARRQSGSKLKLKSTLDSHKMQTHEKVAIALAILHGETDITEQWWDLATLVMEVSDLTRKDCEIAIAIVAKEHVRAIGKREAQKQEEITAYKSEAAERASKSAWKIISQTPNHSDSRHKEPGCTFSCLRGMKGKSKEEKEEALEIAITEGWIVEIDGRYHPGPSQPAQLAH